MKKVLTLALIGVLTFTTFAVSALDLTLSGTGTTQTQAARNTTFGANVGLDYYLNKNVSVGLIQGYSYGTVQRAETDVNVRYNLPLTVKTLEVAPFVGVDGIAGYGNGQPNYAVSPVIGAKVFVKKDVYILGAVNYDIGLNKATDNAIRYTLGLGVRF